MDAALLQRPPLGGLTVLIFMAGCSAEQAYNTGQAWQRRCIANTGGSYEQYRRDTGRK